MWNRLGPCVLLLVGVIVVLPAGADAMWSLDEVQPEPRVELVVTGRMTRVKRDVVRCGEQLYAKRTGTLLVDEVLLRPDGEEVADSLSVYWGNNLGLMCPILMVVEGRTSPGAWLLAREPGGDELCVIGPEEAFFVADDRLGELHRQMATLSPVRTYLHAQDGRLAISVRHFNFSDEPRNVAGWAVRKGKLLLPAPYEFHIFHWPRGGQRTLLRSDPLQAETAPAIDVPAGTWVEQTLDLTELLAHAEVHPDYLVTEILADGERVGLEWVRDDAPDWDTARFGDIMHIQGDWGRPVWWFPSAGRLLWVFVIGGPVLLLAGARLHGRMAHRRGHLCLGLVLGLLWARLLTAYMPDAVLLAMMPDAWHVPRTYWPVAAVGMVLALVPLAAAGVVRRRRNAPGVWLVWLPWVLLPAAVGAVHHFVLAHFAYV